jgi:hypothetical protein
MMGDVTWGVGVIAASTGAYMAGLLGIRAGRSVGAWSVVSAAAGAGVAGGALLLQADVDAASWVRAPAAGAILGVVHARTLFAAGGPFRT